MAAANGARPAASVRLFRCRLDRGHTTCLHLPAWVAWFAHATVLLAWLRQRHQACRIGSLFVQAPSSGRRAPCRGSGRRASPRGTSAAMAAANSVSRAPSARFWRGGVNAKHPHDVTCAGAGCRERQCLFCLLASAGSAGRCRKSISRRQPLPASAAVRAVRLLPAANAFRPAHRLPPTPQFSCRGGMVRCGCQRSIAYRRASRIASIVGAVKRPTGPCNS